MIPLPSRTRSVTNDACETGSLKRRPGAAGPSHAVASRALALEDDGALCRIAGGGGRTCIRGRLEDLRFGQGEHAQRDQEPDDDRSP